MTVTISLVSASIAGLNVPKDLPNIREDFAAHLRDHHGPHLMGATDSSIQSHCDLPFDTPLRSCALNQKSAFQRYDKIAIIGAGVSGLTMAYLLNKKGFNDVTLLEKEDVLGGYAQTYYYNSSLPHDIATSYTVGRYECILQMMEEFYIDSASIPSEHNEARYGAETIIGDWNSFWFWYLNTFLGFELKTAEEFGTVVMEALNRYRAIYLDIMGSGEYLFPGARPAPEKLARLNGTMGEFLIQNDCTALIPVFFLAQSYQGYGFMDEAPVFNGLMWVSPNMVDYLKKKILGVPLPPGIMMSLPKEGYGGLFHRVARGMNIKYSLDISKIKRNRRGVWIEYTDGEGLHHSEKYDYLIVTSRMPASLDMFEHVFPKERALFERLKAKELTTMHVAMDMPHKTQQIYQFEDAHTWVPNKVTTIRNDQKILHPDLVYGPNERDIRFVFGETDPNTTDDDLRASWTQQLEDEGAVSSEILRMKRYEYLSAFSIEDQAAGLPWDIRDLQGSYRTWYTGSFASFESAADVMDYNIQLIQEELCIDEVKKNQTRLKLLKRRCESAGYVLD